MNKKQILLKEVNSLIIGFAIAKTLFGGMFIYKLFSDGIKEVKA